MTPFKVFAILMTAWAGLESPANAQSTTGYVRSNPTLSTAEALGTSQFVRPGRFNGAASGESALSADSNSGVGTTMLTQAVQSRSWCDHAVGGPAPAISPLLALSAAHAAIRQFGASGTWQGIDLALAHALAASPGPSYRLSQSSLSAYVAEFGNGQTCLESVANAELPKAHVALSGNVAVVLPGTGNVALPSGARAVVIDLRGLPNAAGLRDALDQAASLALAAPVNRASRSVRVNYGYTDQWFGDPFYVQYIDVWPDDPIPGAAARDLPLALISGVSQPGESADFAAALRLANRAWLIGADIDMSVAESTWAPVTEQWGLQYHVVDLLDPVTSNRWPDSVPADISVTGLTPFLSGLASVGLPPSVSAAPASRPALAAIENTSDIQPSPLGPGEARAGLIVAHGVLRRFFTYFDVVGDTIDQALMQALTLVDDAALGSRGGPIDRNFYHRTLGFFVHSIHDGHFFTNDYYTQFYGFFDLFCEQINGHAVVRRSGIPGIQPGDTLTFIDGIPADQWIAYYSSVDSAATQGGLFAKVNNWWLTYNLTQPTRTFGIVSVDGKSRTVVANAISFGTPDNFGAGANERANGPLSDLGAPDLYYLNMDYAVTPDDASAMAAIADARKAHGMVVDMRGYPGADLYLVAQALINYPFLSPRFGVPYALSPDQQYALDVQQYSFSPLKRPTFGGPLILLVGNYTLSAAETFATLLVDAKRVVHVVGRQTSGTNGNITGVQLPGGFAFSFTGMQVTHADGSQFDAIGTVPDIQVPLSAADFAAGRDPELEAAIRALH